MDAQAADDAVSAAVQMADQWHLLENVREAFQRALQGRSQTSRRLLGSATGDRMAPAMTGTVSSPPSGPKTGFSTRRERT